MVPTSSHHASGCVCSFWFWRSVFSTDRFQETTSCWERRAWPPASKEMVSIHCVAQLLLATSAAALSTTSVVSPARSELLELLGPRASLAPVPITGRVAELVDELEQAAMVPATPSFLAFGLNGRWQLRALQGPEDLEPAAGPPLHSLALLRRRTSSRTNTPHRKPSSTAALIRANPSPVPEPRARAPSPEPGW